MRKLKVIEHISLDGVVQVSPCPGENDFPYGDWTAPYRTPAGAEIVLGMFGDRFDLLLGRKTYDQWSGYWPTAPAVPMKERINAATKYVMTHRPESLEWGPCEAVGADLVEGVRALKAKDGPDVVLSGSPSLTSTVLEHGLAEELILLMYPTLLGAGKRLFAQGTPAQVFTLQGSRALPSGVAIQHYRLSGPMQKPA